MKSQEPNRSDFQYVEIGHVFKHSNGEDGFSRNKYIHISDIDKYRKEYNDTGIYRSIFLYDNIEPFKDTKDPLIFADFYMDFDDAENIEKAQEDALFCIWKMTLPSTYNLPKEAFHIYFSGYKGFHVIIPWQYFAIKPNKALAYFYKIMAKDLAESSIHQTLDLKVYEKKRLFRLENSIHQKTGYRKVPLTYAQLSKLSIDEIKKLATTNYQIKYPKPTLVIESHREIRNLIKYHEEIMANRFNNQNFKKTLDFTPHCVKLLEEDGPVSGQRNETLAVLTSFYKNQGFSQDEIYNKLKIWNNDSLSDREIVSTMNSILASDRNYGCTTLETLSECIGQECPLYSKHRERIK